MWEWASRVIIRLTNVEIRETQRARGAAPTRTIIRFDGASRRENGASRGPGGAGAFIVDARTNRVLYIGKKHMPKCTNNEAEHEGAMMGLRAAVRLGAWEVELGGDSTLVLNQLSGYAAVRNEQLKARWHESDVAISKINTVSFIHLYRQFNRAADALANCAADGCTEEWYTRDRTGFNGAAKDDGARQAPPTRPDIATCLLGVRRHRTKATLATLAGTDWFHHVRLSVLQHLWQTRNECWAKDLHATESTIRTRVTKDIVHRMLLESATGKAPFPPARVLRPGASFKVATPGDFQDLTQW